MKYRYIIPLLSSGLLLPLHTQAAQVSTPLEIMATVASACVVQTTPIDFGVYEGPEVNTTGTVSVSCNAGVPYQIGLNFGLNYDGANRFMADPSGNRLPYRLTHIGTEWGDQGVTDTYPAPSVSGLGAGDATTYTVDAQLFADQPAPPGVYSDTVTVTVAF